MLNKKILILVFVVAFLFVGCLPSVTPPVIENQAPTITSTAIITATVGVAYTYDVEATDPDGDTLAYSLDVKPDGMTIVSATGVISWTPITAQIGDNPVTVKVFDGALSDTQSFTILVSEAEEEEEYVGGGGYVPTIELAGSYSYSWTTTIMDSTDFDFTVGMGWSGPFPWPPNVYYFFHPDEISPGYPAPIGGAWLFEDIDFDITSAGQTFSVTDGSDFEGFTNLLTNGIDEVIWFGYMGDSDNIASAGGQKDVQESQVFSGTDVGTDFPGYIIKDISLTFNQIYLDPDNVDKLVLDFTIDIYVGLPTP